MSIFLNGEEYQDETSFEALTHPAIPDSLKTLFKMPLEATEKPTGALKPEAGTPVAPEISASPEPSQGFMDRLSILKPLMAMARGPNLEEDKKILQGVWDTTVKAFKLPGEVAQGKIDPSSTEAVQKSFDLAGVVALAPVAKLTTAEATLGSGIIKPKVNQFEQVPFGWSDEEWSLLTPAKKQQILNDPKEIPGTPEFDAHYGYETKIKAPSSFDYEQIGNGKYEVFDPVTGKTYATVSSEAEAKKLMNTLTPQSETMKTMQEIEDILNFWENESAAFGKKAAQNTDYSLEGVSKWFNADGSPKGLTVMPPPPKELSKKEAFKRAVEDASTSFKAATTEIQNKFKDLFRGPVGDLVSGPRVEPRGDYTQPAYRGMTVYEGNTPNPVYNFHSNTAQMYSTANPMLADMYAGYLTQHPGIKIPEGTFPQGAQVQPLLINTKDYHYFDARGAKWQEANKKAMEEARKLKKKGVVVDNVWDEPESTTALGRPNKIYITFPEGAGTVKSRFAEKFDESSPNIMHGIGAIGLGTGATGFISFGGEEQR